MLMTLRPQKRIFAIALAAFLVLPFGAKALWVKQFGVPDVAYKIHIESQDDHNTTYGFYLTSFPCYARNSSEYFDTRPGRNIISLYCLEPPKSVMLGFTTRPRWEFVPKNAVLDGYMTCPVEVSGAGVNSVIPRLAVDIALCERRKLGLSLNKEFIAQGSAAASAGKPVSEIMAPLGQDKASGSAAAAIPAGGIAPAGSAVPTAGVAAGVAAEGAVPASTVVPATGAQ
ncbi:MAG: hypothetical protein LBH41_00310 [Rickettsiales bacterium]|jgi:hypothetical protein|nr:hypothetical protein [Rickettsiales bacterium]